MTVQRDAKRRPERTAAAELARTAMTQLGLGIGWRPELALAIDRRAGLGFIEIVAENLPPSAPIPEAIDLLRERGMKVVPHGISLSLGGAEPPDARRLRDLARTAERVGAPLVSEHIAFVRAGGVEAGHLLPIPRTRQALEVVVENVKIAQDALPVPLALENVSALFEWPDAEMDEAAFVTEVLERTSAKLLLDVSNVYANSRNLGGNPAEFLRHIPLDRLAYVHVGGGEVRDGVYHDTHAGPVPPEAFQILEELFSLVDSPGVLLERDDHFPTEAELNQELDAIVTAIEAGRRRRLGGRG